MFYFFFFKQKTAYEMLRSLVGSEMCIRDRQEAEQEDDAADGDGAGDLLAPATLDQVAATLQGLSLIHI